MSESDVWITYNITSCDIRFLGDNNALSMDPFYKQFRFFLVHHTWSHLLVRNKIHRLLRWILIWIVYIYYMQTVPTIMETISGNTRKSSNDHIIDFIPKEAMYGAASVLKSIFPEFAYNILKDVITMDTDMLLNQDIRNLWREFESFSPEQLIGGVFEQTNSLLRNMQTKYHKIIVGE
ncbi:unnamed protein product [Calicophoron daubneyi]|uniref:Uncharacterized protein n=1 Tax=Calicophoron daubneyi TaxID=300641 RepID=A0AAV2TKQ8_CALDB